MWSTLFAWLLVTVSLCIASEGRYLHVVRRRGDSSPFAAGDVVDVAGPEESDLLPNFEDARNEKGVYHFCGCYRLLYLTMGHELKALKFRAVALSCSYCKKCRWVACK